MGRRLLAVGLGALLASAKPFQRAPPVRRPRSLGWHENCGTPRDPIPITTKKLVLKNRGWRVDLSFRNETRTTLFVLRPHVPGGTYLGLESFETASQREVIERAEQLAAKPGWLAERFSPYRPTLLSSGQGWSGSFWGGGGLPAATPIRVVLGRFAVRGKLPPGFPEGLLCISERVVRLR